MAARLDIEIDQGASFVTQLTWQDDAGLPVDLTGFIARMQARTVHSATTTFLELTTENGGITLTPLTGEILLQITNTQTSLLPLSGGVYDLELESAGGMVTRLVEGNLTINPEVTR